MLQAPELNKFLKVTIYIRYLEYAGRKLGMKIINIAGLIVAVLLSSLSIAGWVDKQGNSIPDSDHMKSADGLVAQLVITDDEAQLLKNWSTPSESVYFPTADKIERNKILTAFIVFGGCAVDADGNCDLQMQMTVYKPDGSVYSTLPVMEVWSGKPVPPGRTLGLSVAYLRVVIEPEDPLGRYWIDANVMDEISGDGMLLTAYFTAVESQASDNQEEPVVSDELEKFGDKMMYFYLTPSPGEFSEFQKYADRFKREIEGNGNGGDILVTVMLARISAKYGWPIVDGAFSTKAREILDGKTDFARYISDDSQVDPSKLDIWWASFFATGDDRYLENIFQYAGQEMPKGDVGKLLVIGAAKWSFKSNCRQHGRVLHFAKNRMDSTSVTESQKAFLKECIDYAESEDEEESISSTQDVWKAVWIA
jgi:hypothetical protein